MRQGREESSQWCVNESPLWATGVRSPQGHSGLLWGTHTGRVRGSLLGCLPLALKSTLPTALQSALAKKYPASDLWAGLWGCGLLPQMPSPQE